ncbi:MAG TPA: FkbM family methyltransferase [Xanthobacteraceae bacterium]|nr:FkbM family methyltransferase [Xanthobacteraceae bacterium]
MEGNECYKFSTIRNFIAAAKAKDIGAIVEIGANIGDVTLSMHDYFPAARIIAFEAVTEYYEIAAARTAAIPNVTVHNKAVTAQHRFLDDLGERGRGEDEGLVILKVLPESGPGWLGGSMVLPRDDGRIADPGEVHGYLKLAQAVTPVTLAEIMREEQLAEIDILKLDCEGCEYSVLGTDADLLTRLRFIVGEYHGFDGFMTIVRRRLFQTHKVNLVGAKDFGCFFAERLDGQSDGILCHGKTGMPAPHLGDTPVEWHPFNTRYVLPEERACHGL